MTWSPTNDDRLRARLMMWEEPEDVFTPIHPQLSKRECWDLCVECRDDASAWDNLIALAAAARDQEDAELALEQAGRLESHWWSRQAYTFRAARRLGLPFVCRVPVILRDGLGISLLDARQQVLRTLSATSHRGWVDAARDMRRSLWNDARLSCRVTFRTQAHIEVACVSRSELDAASQSGFLPLGLVSRAERLPPITKEDFLRSKAMLAEFDAEDPS